MSEYFCTEHQTPFFKRGAMKTYAHPIGEKGVDGKYEGWCNMPEGQEPIPKEEKHGLVEEAVRQGAQVTGSTDDVRLRSMAVAYAKDMVCHGVLEKDKMGEQANWFLRYMLNIK